MGNNKNFEIIEQNSELPMIEQYEIYIEILYVEASKIDIKINVDKFRAKIDEIEIYVEAQEEYISQSLE